MLKRTPNFTKLARVAEVMAPQTKSVAIHMTKVGTISGIEAAALFKVRHLPARIKELRNAGVGIKSVTKYDTTGQRYVRYEVQ